METRERVIFCIFVVLAVSLSGVTAERDSWKAKLGPELRNILDNETSSGVTLPFLSGASDEEITVFVKGDADVSRIGREEYAFKTFSGSIVKIKKSKVENLASQPGVEIIEADKPVSYFLQDSVGIINSSGVNKVTISGYNLTGVHQTVCVLDTGVNYTHPDLGGCSTTEFLNGQCTKVIAGRDVINTDDDPMDDNNHGTHVAGIVGANGSITGVAPGANIAAVKVLNSAGSGNTTRIAQGIDWCVDNAATYNITVVTMSLGTTTLYDDYCDSSFPDITSSVNAAVAKNITVIAASGNDYNNTHIASPGCIKNVTAVGSTTKSDAISDFSNVNSLVSIVAPGSSINSTRRSPASCSLGCSCLGNYMICSGTSMATPHVAGSVAILKQKYTLTYNANSTSVVPITFLNDTGKDITSGSLTFSRINVYNASLKIGTLASVDITNPTNNSYISGSIILRANISSDDYADNATFFFRNSTGTYTICTNTTGVTEFSCTWDTTTTPDSVVNVSVNASNVGIAVNSTNSNITVDNTFPTFSSSGTNASNYYANETIKLFALWSDANPLDYAILRINDTDDFFNHSTLKLQSTSNWSNFTWNASLRAGTNVSWSIMTNDSAGNLNNTMSISNFTVWGWANATDNDLSTNKTRGNTPLRCNILDANFTDGIENYNVTFYNSTGVLGYNLTNASGTAVFYWNTSQQNAGNKSVSCVISNQSDIFYNASYHNFTSSFILKAVPTPTITSPAADGEFFVGENVTFNSTTIQDNGSSMVVTYAAWYNSTGNITDTSQIMENFTWTIPLNHSVGLHNITYNVTGDQGIFEYGQKNVSIKIFGFSEIYDNSTTLANAGSQSTIRCAVRNNNSFVAVDGYNVSFYNGDTFIGSNTTNSTGWSNFHHTFSSAGTYAVKCSITNSSATYYNASVNDNRTWNITISAAPASGGSGGGSGGSGGSGGGAAGGASKKYTLTVAAEDLEIAQGESRVVRVRISNVDDAITSIHVGLAGMPAEWYSIPSYMTSMIKGESQDVGINITLPDNARIGIYDAVVTVSSNETSSSARFTVNVKLSEMNKVVITHINRTLDMLADRISSIDYISRNKTALDTLNRKLSDVRTAIVEGDVERANRTLSEVDDYISKIQSNQIKTIENKRKMQIGYMIIGFISILVIVILLAVKYFARQFKV